MKSGSKVARVDAVRGTLRELAPVRLGCTQTEVITESAPAAHAQIGQGDA